MEEIPAYIVTGFLGSGKTTFINKAFQQKSLAYRQKLLVQFEKGEETFPDNLPNCRCLYFSKKQLEEDAQLIANKILRTLEEYEFDEMWIEWNGMVPFGTLQQMFLKPETNEYYAAETLYDAAKIKKVVFLAEASSFVSMLGRTGPSLAEQAANCDMAVVRSDDEASFAKAEKQLHLLNKGLRVVNGQSTASVLSSLYAPKVNIALALCLGIAGVIGVHFLSRALLNYASLPFDNIINVFIGIILQAVPFLLVGVLLSSALQVFVPQNLFERIFPKNKVLGLLVALLAGFCLPVCDCASIPVFRGLVRKGVPISSAITFLVAAPVINPVVMYSTYYAFNGSWKMVLLRSGFGVVCSLLVGITYMFKSPTAKNIGSNVNTMLCNCGCYDDMESITTFGQRIALFARHSQAEFFDVGKYLMIGAFVSASLQQLTAGKTAMLQTGNLALSMLVMMVLAFVLSLCSSSDAIVARSFGQQFPMGALMAFMVFGPMMDIKNAIMLSGSFSRRFILRLTIATLVICFAVVFVFFSTPLGGMFTL
ncbi:MAG: permease [Oscillospiraceae bacterium]